jgi:HPt (histidine-containing phosphotransfer) domain-containing protein
MDHLTTKFMPRFAALARERLHKALQVAKDRRHERASGVVYDLHAIAGEAGLLGLDAVLVAARKAETAAREFGAGEPSADAVAAFVESLQFLEHALIEAVTPDRSS